MVTRVTEKKKHQREWDERDLRDGGGKPYSIRCVSWLDTRAFKQESHSAGTLALAFAKCVHQLFQFGASLDLEEDLVIVVGDFDIEVF